MFRCYFCKQVTPPGTKRHSVVIATREKTYPTRRKESKRPNRFRDNSTVQDVGGKGKETAQEVPACPACAVKQHEVTTIVAPVETPVPVETPAAETPAPEAAAEAEASSE